MKLCNLIITSCVLLLAGCTETWQTRFRKEFDWNKPIYKTKIGIKVAPPTWLAQEDIPKLLDYVDMQVKWLAQSYPWVRNNFDFGQYVIWIHDAPVAFIAGTPGEHAWVYGWAQGKYLMVAWGAERDEQGRPTGPSTQHLLPALVHELFHAIFHEQYGWGDPGHCFYFPMGDVKAAMMITTANAMLSKPIVWSRKTIDGFRKYKYFPWWLLD